MSNYERSFINGKPTEAFKRRSALYEMSVSETGSVQYKVRSLAEQALKQMHEAKKSRTPQEKDICIG